jgi:peptidoglycan/LPS O-acetylase OafA/YrhL
MQPIGSEASPLRHRIPSLDGLRAVSILFVIASHIVMGRANGHIHSYVAHELLSMLNLGQLGVTVFFVISGYLITSLLMRELQQTGRIKLRRFYARRALRIFPAYYLFLLLIALASALNILSISPLSLVSAATYTVNYCTSCGGTDMWYLTHTWSLAVEEQFYLIWPVALVVLGLGGGLRLALLVVLLCPIVRLLAVANGASIIFRQFHLVADSLATGCLLAGLRSSLHEHRGYIGLLNARLFVLLPISATALALLGSHPSLYNDLMYAVVAPTMINATIALTIDWCISNASTRTGRCLNCGPVQRLGVLSYSLYLWQQVFLDPRRDLSHSWLLMVAAALMAAVASYYLVEQRGLRMRRVFERNEDAKYVAS